MDLALIVVDPFGKFTLDKVELSIDSIALESSAGILERVAERNKKAMCIFNIREEQRAELESKFQTSFNGISRRLQDSIVDIAKKHYAAKKGVGPQPEFADFMLPYFYGDFSSYAVGKGLSHHIVNHFTDQPNEVPLLPEDFLSSGRIVFMNIPMDGETPQGRLLRPQAMVQELCIRNFVPTLAYRMDLSRARDRNESISNAERQRFLHIMHHLPRGSVVITDSQAIDVVHPWTLDEHGHSMHDVTTFSIAMMNYMSGGKLQAFVNGLQVLSQLKSGDHILISEACNHLRIPENCDDIGMVQIPKKLKAFLEGRNIHIEHAYGRDFPAKTLRKYKLVIHCGGCMVDKQKIRARLEDCEEAGVAITNYGLFLAYMHSPYAFARVLKPWHIKVPEDLAKAGEEWLEKRIGDVNSDITDGHYWEGYEGQICKVQHA